MQIPLSLQRTVRLRVVIVHYDGFSLKVVARIKVVLFVLKIVPFSPLCSFSKLVLLLPFFLFLNGTTVFSFHFVSTVTIISNKYRFNGVSLFNIFNIINYLKIIQIIQQINRLMMFIVVDVTRIQLIYQIKLSWIGLSVIIQFEPPISFIVVF